MLCFALVGATAMAVTRWIGVDRGLALALVVLTAGLVLRVLDGTPALLAGTFVACSGIALANVLIPAIVKEHFPGRVGAMTGAYTSALSLGSAAGAALAVPLTNATGSWRLGLGLWAVLGVAAAIAWAPFARGRAVARSSERGASMWRSPTAWAVTVLFGTQSLYAYVMMSWLPSLLRRRRVHRRDRRPAAGDQHHHRRPVLLPRPELRRPAAPPGPPDRRPDAADGRRLGRTLASRPRPAPGCGPHLLGAGGAVFPVVLLCFALRTSTSADTAALSTMGQSVGYLMAAGGPFLVGVLHHSTGGWGLPCALLVGLGVVQVGAGYLAGRPVVIGSR